MREYCVYILRCNDGSFYTGFTSDLEKRVSQHHEGVFKQCHTYGRRPVELVYLETFHNTNDAISREKQLKKWSRAKKAALIKGEYEHLSKYAKKVFLH
ncbi:hypothetical protein COU78_04040 [Candidatus Peregrinibacteria bacterium CG10_big_fil_rev_8_21_14_0_10_49_24]|nr:MAG: hypothetical protein COV83_01390 [Candidatus Peregrinibacteria bacterium CG11_big_fil_rev_8_21_14_0_20_49_14]PIR50907.1 MAG: hypothetical protein COU78_04040 [Candidatus Peregrinibacteria bacterium CG10_big_fil_rev_8_21_14_0_10_49_24]PJA67719.1 MAG: hypothetical protein CO157_03110 [Candidatus Peregrinibacteria bacterium CG_4_9_14_3_um_filter_49_12]